MRDYVTYMHNSARSVVEYGPLVAGELTHALANAEAVLKLVKHTEGLPRVQILARTLDEFRHMIVQDFEALTSPDWSME